jgi:hypothetical protein
MRILYLILRDGSNGITRFFLRGSRHENRTEEGRDQKPRDTGSFYKLEKLRKGIVS